MKRIKTGFRDRKGDMIHVGDFLYQKRAICDDFQREYEVFRMPGGNFRAKLCRPAQIDDQFYDDLFFKYMEVVKWR